MRLDMVATVVGIGMLGYLVYTQLSPTNRLQQHAVVTNEQGQKTAGPTSKGAPIKAGQLDPNGIKLMHNTTGNKINMERGTDHRNGQRYNVNHRFTQYLSIGYYKIGKGQKIINHKTDGPNHGGCTQLPRCTWLEPQIELSSGKQVLNTEHPHPQGHDNRPCPSCKTVGAISAGQWLGWGVAAYGPEGARTVEAWVDKGGLVGGTKPANQWVMTLKETDKGQVTSPTLAKRKLPIDGRGMEAEVRMHGATSGDTDFKYCTVYEIIPPTGGTTAAYAYLRRWHR